MAKKTVTAILLTSACLFLAGCSAITIIGEPSESKAAKKTIVATTFAAYDWTKNITKGSGNIDVLYPVGSNIDIHFYHRTPEETELYKNADLIIAIGGDFDSWLKTSGINQDKIVYLLDEVDALKTPDNEDAPETYDCHIWLSLQTAKRCINAIKIAATGIDTINTELYEKNSLDYIRELNDLSEKYQQVIDGSQNRALIIADRFPFGYLVNEYEIDCYAAFSECSTNTEVTHETIEYLGQKLSELNLQNVCVIAHNEEIAQDVIDLSGNEDVGIVMLNSMQTVSSKEADSLSYINIMEENLEAVEEAVKLRQPDRPAEFEEPLVMFVGGDGQTIYQTKVWETEDGYYFENYTIVPKEHNKMQWDEFYNDNGYVASDEEILEIAVNRYENMFLYNGKTHEIAEFAKQKWRDAE